MRTTPRGDRLERCKVDANEPLPFACPEGCVFYEPRKVSSAGWHVPQDPEQALSPTAAGHPSRTSPRRSTVMPSPRSQSSAASTWAA